MKRTTLTLLFTILLQTPHHVKADITPLMVGSDAMMIIGGTTMMIGFFKCLRGGICQTNQDNRTEKGRTSDEETENKQASNLRQAKLFAGCGIPMLILGITGYICSKIYEI